MLILSLLCALTAFPGGIAAHAFGDVFSRSLPFRYLALGAAVALIYSFATFVVFADPDEDLNEPSVRARFAVGHVSAALTVTGCVGYIAVIVSGIAGEPLAAQNPASIVFWTFIMLGLAYLSCVFDGVARALNPIERIMRALPIRALLRYPRSLGMYPALTVYGILIGLELFTGGVGGAPFTVAMLLIGYALITLIGTLAFGAVQWFANGDFFSVFFSLIGRCASFRLNVSSVDVVSPLVRLAYEWPTHISTLIFIVFMLASTSFDGLHETALWSRLFGTHPTTGILSLFLITASSLSLYAVAVWSAGMITKSARSYSEQLLRYAYSLIPIAIAYNAAHYFVLFVNGSADMIRLVSDPFERGWNLFGTAAFAWSASSMRVESVWASQLLFILVGHISATYIAHRIASLETKNERAAALGQLPMLALMVGYTIFALWILSLGAR